MIPVFIYPAFAQALEIGEIDYSTDRVLAIAGDKKIGDVVMAMEIFAFAAVPIKSMPRAKFDAAHNSQAHGSGLSNSEVEGGE